MKTKLFQIIVLAISFSFFTSCIKGDPTDCFKSTGKDTWESRSVANFNTIVLYDNVNLVLTQDEEITLDVFGGSNLLKKINTDINDGVLTIRNTNSCNWVRSFNREVTVYAHVDSLIRIDYRGSGDISSSNTIISDSLKLDIKEGAGKIDLDVDVDRNYIYFTIGTADVYYSGKSNISYIAARSFGPIYAQEMESLFTFMSSEGSNDCYVRTQNKLEAAITNIGDIYYYGNPEILINNTGEGKLIKLGD